MGLGEGRTFETGAAHPMHFLNKLTVAKVLSTTLSGELMVFSKLGEVNKVKKDSSMKKGSACCTKP